MRFLSLLQPNKSSTKEPPPKRGTPLRHLVVGRERPSQVVHESRLGPFDEQGARPRHQRTVSRIIVFSGSDRLTEGNSTTQRALSTTAFPPLHIGKGEHVKGSCSRTCKPVEPTALSQQPEENRSYGREKGTGAAYDVDKRLRMKEVTTGAG